MSRLSPVEFTACYATTVEALPDAWAFVMEHLEKVGPDPRIEISPVWVVDTMRPTEDVARHFSVVVNGMVEEEEGEPHGLRSV